MNAKAGRGRGRTKKVAIQQEEEGGMLGEEDEEKMTRPGRKRNLTVKAQTNLDANSTKSTKGKPIKRGVKDEAGDDEENDERGSEVDQPQKKKRRTDK